MWKSIAAVLTLMFGTYISVSYSKPLPNPEDYNKVARPFNPKDSSLSPAEYCYDGVVYVAFYYSNYTWGSVKFDSKTKSVVTCK